MSDRENGISGHETDDDDKKLESLGYVPSFKREFSNLATVCGLHPISVFTFSWTAAFYTD
jgi:hypothetical protein